MKFLAVSHNTGDPSAHLDAETARIAELVAAGTVERVLLKADWSGAVLILETPDEEQARAAVDSLPIATHGLTTFTLTAVVDPPAPAGDDQQPASDD